MKTKLALIIGVISLTIGSCEKSDLEIDVPECIEKEIKAFRESAEGCKGASVWKYNRLDEDIYLFTPGDCENDRLIKTFDTKCNLRCYWEIDGPHANCSMPYEIYYSLEGELVWENK